jgi:hypothetical protein
MLTDKQKQTTTTTMMIISAVSNLASCFFFVIVQISDPYVSVGTAICPNHAKPKISSQSRALKIGVIELQFLLPTFPVRGTWVRPTAFRCRLNM